MPDFTTHQGDTSPTWTDSLVDATGATVNLTGASVQFVMRTLTASTPTTNAAATIVTPATGQVSYTPTATDTALAGHYMGSWVVTFSGGAVSTFPVDGYLDIWIEENLTTPGGALLLSLSEAKQHLRIDASDRSHDDELLQMISGITPAIEQITGPILQRQCDEWYEGGQTFVELRQNPVVTLTAVSEFRGPIEYALKLIADPAHGDIYSAMLDPDTRDRVVRRTSGGGVIAFPVGPQTVHVVYTAGRVSVPSNVTEAVREYLRIYYQGSEQAGTPHFGGGYGGAPENDGYPSRPPIGFSLPGRVRELLAPSRRAPVIV